MVIRWLASNTVERTNALQQLHTWFIGLKTSSKKQLELIYISLTSTNSNNMLLLSIQTSIFYTYSFLLWKGRPPSRAMQANITQTVHFQPNMQSVNVHLWIILAAGWWMGRWLKINRGAQFHHHGTCHPLVTMQRAINYIGLWRRQRYLVVTPLLCVPFSCDLLIFIK